METVHKMIGILIFLGYSAAVLGDTTFSITYENLTRDDAERNCSSHGPTYQLAKIHNDDAWEKLKKLQQNSNHGNMQAWIGLVYSYGSLGWRWIWADGTWLSYEPPKWIKTDFWGRKCTIIENKDVVSKPCSETVPAFVCEGDFPNPCKSNPCLWDGVCAVVDFTYSCNCKPGIYGDNCQNHFPNPCKPNPCLWDGVCAVVDFTYSCNCKPGRYGDNCQNRTTLSISFENLNQKEAIDKCKLQNATLAKIDLSMYTSTNNKIDRLLEQCTGFNEGWFGLERHNDQFLWQDKTTAIIHQGNFSVKYNCFIITADDDYDRYIHGMNCSEKSSAFICEGNFKNPCEPNPCLNGGSCCVVDFNYSCSCTSGRLGDRCEKIIMCPHLNNKPHVLLNYENTTYNSSLYQQCVEGYKPVGTNDVRVCKNTEQWSGEELMCELITCPHEENDSLVLMNYESVTFNSTLYQHCIEGYKEVGKNDVRVCNESAQWSGEKLTCELIMCPHLRNKAHVLLNYENTTYNSSLYQQCVEGYEPVGTNEVRLCNETGQWSGEELACERITCSHPENNPNTTINSKGIKYLDEITYSCESGNRKKNGDHVRVCQANGTWSGTALICQEKCYPPEIPHTTSEVKIIGNDEIAIYQCTYGYKMVSGLPNKTCHLDQGSLMWHPSGDNLNCEFAPNNDLIVLPQDPKPNTTKERIMERLGMLEVDLETSNITVGSVAGIVFVSITIAIIISLDITMKKEVKRMKRNLRYKRKRIAKILLK